MRPKFCIRGKKSGIVGSAISNFWSYVLFVFIVIIFFVIFKLQADDVKESKITSLESQTSFNVIALNYLRTPIAAETDGVTAINDGTFADFIIRQITPLYSTSIDTAELQEVIDQTVNENLEGFNRIMILTDIEACLYDSWNRGCQSPQIFYYSIPIGSVILPIPTKSGKPELVKVVVQGEIPIAVQDEILFG